MLGRNYNLLNERSDYDNSTCNNNDFNYKYNSVHSPYYNNTDTTKYDDSHGYSYNHNNYDSTQLRW